MCTSNNMQMLYFALRKITSHSHGPLFTDNAMWDITEIITKTSVYHTLNVDLCKPDVELQSSPAAICSEYLASCWSCKWCCIVLHYNYSLKASRSFPWHDLLTPGCNCIAGRRNHRRGTRGCVNIATLYYVKWDRFNNYASRACSKACATFRTVTSSKWRPTIIIPTGRPSTKPALIDRAGWPLMSKGAVLPRLLQLLLVNSGNETADDRLEGDAGGGGGVQRMTLSTVSSLTAAIIAHQVLLNRVPEQATKDSVRYQIYY